MPRKTRLSIDQGIKELLQLRPIDAFAFLLPDLHARRGTPVRYEFAQGCPILLVLVEHWSQARSMDLVRTAHYYLDLMERFPSDEIVPVALVTELEEHEIPDTLIGHGADEEFLRFRTRVVQLAREDAARWSATSNLVATTQLLAMGGALDRVHKLIAAAEAFRESASDEEIALLFPLFVELGRLDETEEETIMSYLATMPKPRLLVKMEQLAIQQGLEKGMQQGIQQGLEKGMREARLEDARKMLSKGYGWDAVTDITGIRPEDLAS